MTLANTPPDLSANGLRASAATTPAIPAVKPAMKPVATSGTVPREIHNFLSDIEDLIEETTSITGEDLARAKARIGERVARARRAVSETGSALAQGSRHNAEIANRYVQERPWTMIGIGVALGGLIGFLLARAR